MPGNGTLGVSGTEIDGVDLAAQVRNLSWHASVWGTPSAILSQPLHPGVLPYFMAPSSVTYARLFRAGVDGATPSNGSASFGSKTGNEGFAENKRSFDMFASNNGNTQLPLFGSTSSL